MNAVKAAWSKMVWEARLRRNIATSSPSVGWAFLASGFFLALWALGVPLGPVQAWLVGLHEFFHALAAIVTGGSVQLIQTSSDSGGATISSGGFYPVMSMAGYVGTGALGALCLRHCGSAWVRLALMAACVGLALALIFFTRGAWSGALQALAVDVAVFWLARSRAGSLATGCCGALLLSMGLTDARVLLIEATSRTDAGLLADWLGAPWLAWPIALGYVAAMAVLWIWALWGLARDARNAIAGKA